MMETMKKALLAFVAILGFASQAGSKTQITVGQIQPAASNGVLVNVTGKGWTLATLDSTLTLDTSSSPPVLRATAGPSPTFVDWVTPTGTIDGTNAVFTLPSAPSPPASLTVIANGLTQRAGADFTLSGGTITFVPGAVPQPGDVLGASYRR